MDVVLPFRGSQIDTLDKGVDTFRVYEVLTTIRLDLNLFNNNVTTIKKPVNFFVQENNSLVSTS